MNAMEMLQTALNAALFAAVLCFGTMALAAILTAVVRHPWAALWHAFALAAVAYLTVLTADYLGWSVWVIFAALWVAIHAAALSVREKLNQPI